MGNGAGAHVRLFVATSLVASCSVDDAGLGRMPPSFALVDGGNESRDTAPVGSGGGGIVSGSGGGTGAGTGGSLGPVGTGGSGLSGGSGGAVAGSGGATAGSGGTAAGSGGMRTGSGGVTVGSGGTAAGSGGAAAGSGGTNAGSGGTNAGSGGAIAGSGGAIAGSGGTNAGSGGAIAGSGGAVAGTGGDRGGSGGSAGTGGRGGSSGNCAPCPPCHRCNGSGACLLDPMSLWKLKCVSARIDMSRPQGSTWDPPTDPGGGGTAPDPVCALFAGQMALGSSSVRMNTFEPSWGDSITPSGSGVTAAFLISQSAPWSIYVGDDDDGPLSTSEEICEIAPRLSIADLVTGTVTFSDVDSCVNLIIEIQCAGP